MSLMDSIRRLFDYPEEDEYEEEEEFLAHEGTSSAGASAAVSYTHLDVYKRQPRLFTEALRPET